MQITAITPQKRRKDRVNIFIDGKFSFSLDLNTYIQEKLSVNQEVDEEDIGRLIKEGEFGLYYDRVLRLVSARPRSRQEIIDYLKRKQAGEDEINLILSKLIKHDLIDDLKFSQWWLEQRETFRPRSIRGLKSELFKKGISREIVEEVLENRQDLDNQMAIKLAQKVIIRYQKLPSREMFQKMVNYLMARGFSYDISKETIDKLTKKE